MLLFSMDNQEHFMQMRFRNNPLSQVCVTNGKSEGRSFKNVSYLCTLFMIMTPAQGSVILKTRLKGGRQGHKHKQTGLSELSTNESSLKLSDVTFRGT